MLSYYKNKDNPNFKSTNYSINFASEEDADAAIEQYKADIMQEGDEIVDGSETVIYTLQPQASLTVIDQSTGEVKAIVGGRGDKTASKTLNRATDTTRQPGSTFKILAAYSLRLMQVDLPLPPCRMMPLTLMPEQMENLLITTTDVTVVLPL